VLIKPNPLLIILMAKTQIPPLITLLERGPGSVVVGQQPGAKSVKQRAKGVERRVCHTAWSKELGTWLLLYFSLPNGLPLSFK
jgi:hypothetical protein